MAYLESQKSAQVFAKALDETAPGKVTGLIFSVLQGKVDLSWDAITVDENGVELNDLAAYSIFRKKTVDGSFEKIGQVDAEETSFTDTEAKDGATYFYAVAAVDSADSPNEGEKSAEVEVKTIPSIPTGLEATPASGLIRLDWTSVQVEEDPKSNENLAGYNIYRSEVDGEDYEKIGSAGKEETSFEDSSVVSETTYYYVITSYDNSN